MHLTVMGTYNNYIVAPFLMIYGWPGASAMAWHGDSNCRFCNLRSIYLPIERIAPFCTHEWNQIDFRFEECDERLFKRPNIQTKAISVPFRACEIENCWGKNSNIISIGKVPYLCSTKNKKKPSKNFYFYDVPPKFIERNDR